MENVDRSTFIEQNMGLVHMVVMRHAKRIIGHPSVDRDDLENIGAIGLIKAYDRFDPSFGTKFSTYAVPMIEGEIKRYLRDSLDMIRFSRSCKDDYYAISRADLIDESPQLISDTLDIPIDRVQIALEYYRYKFTDSLDRVVYEDEGSSIILADSLGVEVDFDSDLEIKMLLDKLDERTRKIVEFRLHGLNQNEIGKIIGISQVQVSRILAKLQNELKEGGVKMKESKAENKPVKKKQAAAKKKPDYDLAKKMAIETELNPSQIQDRTGVSYPTAYNYVKSYRLTKEENKEVEVKKTVPKAKEAHRLDVPKEVANKSMATPTDGFMTMTLKLTVGDAKSQLEEIVKGMEMLGFKDLDITIQSRQTA